MKSISLKTTYLCLAIIIATTSCKQTEDTKENLQEASELQASDPIHNSKNSLDYLGTYTGILPCADCEGIETTVTLIDEQNYTLSMRYLGKEYEAETEQGSYHWNDEGSIITLERDDDLVHHYKVGENMLIRLDQQQQVIEGDLADFYRLKKE